MAATLQISANQVPKLVASIFGLEASIGADVWGVAAKSTSWFMFSPPSYSPSESSDPLEKSLLQFFSLQSRLLVHCGNFNLNHESMPWARHAGFGQDLLRRILNHKERQGQPHPQPLRGLFRYFSF
ncbi:unnamed protein product [Cladocopium goreaui]|nr:unnamed protein product [Cladocopium goreaui]